MTTIRRRGWVMALLFAANAARAQAVQRDFETDADRLPRTHTNGSVLLKNGTLLTVSHGTIATGDLLVRSGKIAAIGTGLVVPADTLVIDLQGKHVMPGVIDCHSHIAVYGDVNEGTVSISGEVRIGDVLDGDDLDIYRELAGGVTTANILHGSANTIGGQNAVIKLKYRALPQDLQFKGAPRGIKFALGENPKQSNFTAARGQRFPNSRMGVEAVLRRAFTRAQDYMAEWDQYARQKSLGAGVLEPRRDLRLETLAGILRGEILVHSHCYRADEILMLMRVAEDFHFRIATFQHALEAYKVAPEIAKHGAQVSTFSDWWAYKFEAFDAIPYNGALTTAAGITTSFNSDSAELARHLNLESAKAVKYGGLSEEQSLALVTWNPAKQLGIDARVGTLDLGKDADLAIFNGHPQSTYSHCVMTLVDGEVAFERAGGLDELTLAAPAFALTGGEPLRRGHLPTSDHYVIRDATIHTLAGPDIEHGAILIERGVITEVGSQVTIPPGASVVDGTGLHVYPGMIDSGTTLGLTEVGSVAGTSDANEIGDLQPDLRARTAINPHSELIPVARANGITTVLVQPSAGTMGGQSALVDLAGWTSEEMVESDPVALHLHLPYVPAKRFDSEDQESDKAKSDREQKLQTIADLFTKAKKDAQVRAEHLARGSAMPPRDAKLAALLPYLKGEKPVVIDADSKDNIAQAVKFASDAGLRLIIAGGQDAWRVADLLLEHRTAVLLGPVLTTPSSPTDPYDAPFFNAARLYAKGVPFAIRSDAAANVRNLPYQAAMAAAYGLPRDAALRSITVAPAEIFGVADRLGTLAKGKVANVVVTDGDPLEIRTSVHYVFVRGTPVSLETKHTRLYEQFLQRLEPAKAARTPAPAASSVTPAARGR